MGMDGSFGMIGGVFDAIDCRGFEGLIFVREFLHAFIGRVFDVGKLLRIAGLPGTVRAHFSSVISQFIELGLVIAARSFHHMSSYPPIFQRVGWVW
jgi:hypothetical protein